LLYQIDPRQYKADLDGAKAKLRAAKAAMQYAVAYFNRTEELYSRKAASKEELELAAGKKSISEGEVAKAEAAVEEAKNNLDFTKITAPISGRISRTQVDLGNLVNAGGGDTLLTTIVTVDPFYVSFDVDERAMRRYQQSFHKNYKGKWPPPSLKDLHIPVYVALEGDKGYPHKGELFFADNQVNPKTGTKEVRGELSNKEGIYDEGMRARVSIPVSDPYKALLITERAVATDQGQKFVYVVNKDNVVERRDITPGRVREGLLVIKEGLKKSDWVIVNGIQRVRDGMTVKPKKSPMPGAAEFDQVAMKNRRK
jgi:RND family efflux transporter MFP subunit